MIGVRARGAGQRANAPRRFEAVDARQRHVHQHDVVAALDRASTASSPVPTKSARWPSSVRMVLRMTRPYGLSSAHRTGAVRAGAPSAARRAAPFGVGVAIGSTTDKRNVEPRPGVLVDREVAVHQPRQTLDHARARGRRRRNVARCPRSPARRDETAA